MERFAKINIGCGTRVLPDFLNIDLFVDHPDIIKMDVRKLDFEDESFEFVLAEDILEHMPRLEWKTTLDEWIRVLKVGGNINIRFPDMRVLCEALLNTNTKEQWDSINRKIYGGQGDGCGIAEGMFHFTGFCYEYLRTYLEENYRMQYASHSMQEYNCILEMTKCSFKNILSQMVSEDQKNLSEEMMKRNHTYSYWEERGKREDVKSVVGVDEALEKKHLEYLKERVNGKKIFEVGCGCGRWIEMLNKYVKSFEACERSPVVRSRIKEEYQPLVQCCALKDLILPQNKYDIIFESTSLSSCFYEFDDSKIRMLQNAIKKDGRIIFLEAKSIVELSRSGFIKETKI